MQKLLFILLTVLALLGLPTWSHAQTDIVTTTITEPITTLQPQNIVVNSATGITAGIWLLIDNEVMRVGQNYSSGTSIPVLRTGRPTTHGDNAVVWIFPIGAIVQRAPQGSCTRGEGEAQYTLTLIQPTGAIGACRTGGGATGVAGTRNWVITDISGAEGVLSGNPPETP